MKTFSEWLDESSHKYTKADDLYVQLINHIKNIRALIRQPSEAYKSNFNSVKEEVLGKLDAAAKKYRAGNLSAKVAFLTNLEKTLDASAKKSGIDNDGAEEAYNVSSGLVARCLRQVKQVKARRLNEGTLDESENQYDVRLDLAFDSLKFNIKKKKPDANKDVTYKGSFNDAIEEMMDAIEEVEGAFRKSDSDGKRAIMRALHKTAKDEAQRVTKRFATYKRSVGSRDGYVDAAKAILNVFAVTTGRHE